MRIHRGSTTFTTFSRFDTFKAPGSTLRSQLTTPRSHKTDKTAKSDAPGGYPETLDNGSQTPTHADHRQHREV